MNVECETNGGVEKHRSGEELKNEESVLREVDQRELGHRDESVCGNEDNFRLGAEVRLHESAALAAGNTDVPD